MSQRTVVWVSGATVVVLALVLSAAASAAQEKQAPAKVAGKWEMTWEGRQGQMTATLTLEQDGEKLKGALTGPGGRENPVTGSVKGNSVTLVMKRETPRGEFTTEYKGKVEGDSMKGTAEMGGGQFTIEWAAKKVK